MRRFRKTGPSGSPVVEIALAIFLIVIFIAILRSW